MILSAGPHAGTSQNLDDPEALEVLLEVSGVETQGKSTGKNSVKSQMTDQHGSDSTETTSRGLGT